MSKCEDCGLSIRTHGTVEIPVAELEALRDARPSLATNPYPADPIIARLPPKEPDHVERLRKIHAAIDAGFRSHEGLTREEHNARDKAALEAAIRAMESKS